MQEQAICSCGKPAVKAWLVYEPDQHPFSASATVFDHCLVACDNGCQPRSYPEVPAGVVIQNGPPERAN